MLQRKVEDFLAAHPVSCFRDCTSAGLSLAEQRWCIYMFVWEDHLYIELNTKNKTTLMLLCSPSRTVKRLSRGWLQAGSLASLRSRLFVFTSSWVLSFLLYNCRTVAASIIISLSLFNCSNLVISALDISLQMIVVYRTASILSVISKTASFHL